MRSIKKGASAGAALAAGVLGIGVAFAAWTSNGSGSGSAKAITAQAVTVSGGAGSPQLYPGGSADVSLSITNPNPYPVVVTAVNPESGSNGTTPAPITSDKGQACDASTGVTFVGQNGLSQNVPAGGSATLTLAGAAQMDNSSDDSCQGATFTIPVSVTAHSGTAQSGTPQG